MPLLGGGDGWTVSVEGFDPEVVRVRSPLLTIADGVIGTGGEHRLARIRPHDRDFLPRVSMKVRGSETDLVAWPAWYQARTARCRRSRLSHGCWICTPRLERQQLGRQPGSSRRCVFVSLERPGTAVLRAKGVRTLARESDRPLAVPPGKLRAHGPGGRPHFGRSDTQVTGGLAVRGGVNKFRDGATGSTVSQPTNVDPVTSPDPDPKRCGGCEQVEHLGFENLLSEHRRRVGRALGGRRRPDRRGRRA